MVPDIGGNKQWMTQPLEDNVNKCLQLKTLISSLDIVTVAAIFIDQTYIPLWDKCLLGIVTYKFLVILLVRSFLHRCSEFWKLHKNGLIQI
jgi:hypothetical protein